MANVKPSEGKSSSQVEIENGDDTKRNYTMDTKNATICSKFGSSPPLGKAE